MALFVRQESAQPLLFDITVAFAVLPVAEIVIAKRVDEQLHHALLGHLFDLADGAHTSTLLMRSDDHTSWTSAPSQRLVE